MKTVVFTNFCAKLLNQETKCQ